MSSGKTIAALAVSLALLTGCGPKQPKVRASQAAQAPSLPPTQMVALISPVPPPIPPTKRPVLKLDTTAPPDTRTETADTETHQTPKHQHNKPVVPQETPSEGTRVASVPTPPAPQIPNAQPPEMSPIGQLSTTSDNTNDTADRHVISEQIDATENGLNGIKRPLGSDEQKTASQIRSYITRARDALKSDDLDGARTLSTKAHLLLIELTKQ